MKLFTIRNSVEASMGSLGRQGNGSEAQKRVNRYLLLRLCGGMRGGRLSPIDAVGDRGRGDTASARRSLFGGWHHLHRESLPRSGRDHSPCPSCPRSSWGLRHWGGWNDWTKAGGSCGGSQGAGRLPVEAT